MSLWIDKKYVGIVSLRLAKFKQKSDKTWTFRCPVCGDSKTDMNKTRGYLYAAKDQIRFKCHNCGASNNMQGFLGIIDPAIARAYSLEVFRAKNYEAATEKFANDNDIVAVPTKPFRGIKQLEAAEIYPVTDARCRRGMSYIISRRIPKQHWGRFYYTNDFTKLERLAPAYKDRLFKEERIIIPFTNQMKKMTGVTGRSLNPNAKKRYINVKFDEDELLIFGADLMDRRHVVYVLEGAFDSVFVKNGVAIGGSDLKRALLALNDCKTVFVFDNEPRNKEIVAKMQQLIDLGQALVIWPSTWKYKDINQAILDDVDQNEIQRVIYNSTHYELEMQIAFNKWKRI